MNGIQESNGNGNVNSLIVVSNRLPFVLIRGEDGALTRKSSAGGLVTAVAPVVVHCNGKTLLQMYVTD